MRPVPASIAIVLIPALSLLAFGCSSQAANPSSPQPAQQAGASIDRISMDQAGGQADGKSLAPSVSADGRYVAFESLADNLVSGDSNKAVDIFVKDTQTGTVSRVSTAADGTQANGNSHSPSISADGRYVAFYSYASNLVPDDSKSQTNVYVKDMLTENITCVSIAAGGMKANGNSDTPAISADGRYVAFHSLASNLVAVDGNNSPDIFVKDTATGSISIVSTSSSGEQGNGESLQPAISADGRYVAFVSEATNFVPGDSNDRADVFLKDTQTGRLTRLSESAAGIQGNGGCAHPAISADGRYVAFASGAGNLVPGDWNGYYNIFVKDTIDGSIRLLSATADGSQANSGSDVPSISADGRLVAFYSYASNLPGGADGHTNVFVADTATGSVTLASAGQAGSQADGDSKNPAISGDGKTVVFESDAGNLTTDDTNQAIDIFAALMDR